MQAKVKTLKAKDENSEEYIVYPKTRIDCVTNENGEDVEHCLKNYVNTEFKESITAEMKTYVSDNIDNANYLSRQIVTEVPTAETAKENIVYLYKPEGEESYQEYQLIDGAGCVPIGSPQSCEYPEEDVTNAINALW